MSNPQAPLQQQDRLVSLDIIRGVALFGILLMNITGMGLPYAYSDPTVYGGATGADLWAWITTSMLFEGTQRGLFSLLFGLACSCSPIASRPGAAMRPTCSFRRNLWLVGFGIVHAYLLLWTGEILYAYGVTALFVFAFRRATPRTLITIALAGLLIGAAWYQLEAYEGRRKYTAFQEAQTARTSGATLSRKQTKALEAWPELVGHMKPSAEKIQDKLEAMRGSYSSVFRHQAPIVAESESWMQYRYFFDIFSMMLIGMALFKMGLLNLGHPRRPYVWMVMVGYGIGLTVNFFEVRHLLNHGFDVFARLRVEVSYDVGRLAMTTGHVGLLMLFCNSGWLGWLQRRLAAVGQMALSNYVTHSVVAALVFYGFGFGLYGHLARHQLYYVVFSIWTFQLVISPIWLAHYRFGPVEWLWRSLTYGQRQPMRRVARAGDGTPLVAPAG